MEAKGPQPLAGYLLIALSLNLEPLLIGDLFIGLAPGELGSVRHFLAVKREVDVALLIHTSADLLGAYWGWGEGRDPQEHRVPQIPFSREGLAAARWKPV